MKTVERLAAAIRRICFTPTLRDSRSRSDLYFMEITLLERSDKFPTMGVSARRAPAKGLRLVYNPAFVDSLSDTDLHAILCHEAQHLRRQDLKNVQQWLEPRDWYKGWDGAQLANVACDLQINDYLESLGYPVIEGGMYGPPTLGHTTDKQDFESLMREVADKLPPQESMGDVQPGDDSENGEDGADGESAESDQTGKTPMDLHTEAEKSNKGISKGGQTRSLIANDADVARWGNFLKEIMDVRKQEDTWQRIPKRLAGVDAYQDREYIRPAVRPLPRKHALVAIDVSGSMDERLVTRMLSAVRNSPANYDLQVVTFNHDVYVWKDFRTNAEIPNRGGGTNIEPVVRHVKSMLTVPERVLVLTDGEFHIEPGSIPTPQNWIFSIYGDNAQDFQNEHGLRAVQMEALLP